MQEKVYEIVKNIPYGQVLTYKDIAIILGNKYLARYVGNVLHLNNDYRAIPCYRVVNSKGKLASNYAFGIEKQKELLESEGIIVTNYQVDIIKYKKNV